MGKVLVLCPKRLDRLNLLYCIVLEWFGDGDGDGQQAAGRPQLQLAGVNTEGLMHLTHAQFKRCSQALTGDGCAPNLIITSSG